MATLEQIGQALTVLKAQGKLGSPEAKTLAQAYQAMKGQQAASPPNATLAAASPADATYARSVMQAQQTMPRPQAAPQQSPSFGDATLATINGLTGSVPFLQQASDALLAGGETVGDMLTGNSGEKLSDLVTNKPGGFMGHYQDIQDARARMVKAAPLSDLAGNVAGTIAGAGALGATKLGADAIGLTGKMLPQLVNSSASTAGYEGLQGIAHGHSGAQLLADEGIGGLTGAGGVVAGKAVDAASKGVNWALGGIPGAIKNAINPDAAASKMVGNAFAADARNGTAINPALEQAAADNGQQLTNLDRGGTVVRSLARTASNVSPDANATLQASVDRGPVSQDSADFLKSLVGGHADDLATRQTIHDVGRITNNKAYTAAHASPAAKNIYTPRIENLMQAPEMQQAIIAAEGAAKTRAAINNAPPPGPAPFRVGPDGKVISTPVAPPSLQFWDQVQRGLRAQMEALKPTQKTEWSQLNDLRSALNGELDKAVPSFADARMGAAKAFGAENALDAGRNFANARGQVPEAQAAFAKFSPLEQKLFGTGWASSLVDKLGTSDTYGIVKQTFENPNARAMSQMALGPQKAARLESFLKVQALQNFSKEALKGNSSTAKQLIAAGAIGTGGVAYGGVTGDWRPLTVGGLLMAGRAGAKYLGKTVDDRVMQNVATLLASGDKASLSKVVANASVSPQWMTALNLMFRGMGPPAAAAVGQQLATN